MTPGERDGWGMGQRDTLAVSGLEGRPVGEELGVPHDLRRKEPGIWRKIAQKHEHGPQVMAQTTEMLSDR